MEGDKVAIVTGSSSGIGRAIAKSLAHRGYHMVIHGCRENSFEKTLKEVDEITGRKNLGVTADLRKRQDCSRLIDEVILKFNRIDVLVNNAGLFLPISMDAGMDAFDTYQDVIRTNLDSAVLMTLLAVPHLKKAKGCIVNISSNLDRICLHSAAAYSAAKAALTAFTKSCAVELAPKVRVNSISPGPIATKMCEKNGQTLDEFKEIVGDSTLVGRVGEADEIARVVVFMCSPDSSFITGSDIVIDGGSTIKPSGRIMGEVHGK